MLLNSQAEISENRRAGVGVRQHRDGEEAAENSRQKLPLMGEKAEWGGSGNRQNRAGKGHC